MTSLPLLIQNVSFFDQPIYTYSIKMQSRIKKKGKQLAFTKAEDMQLIRQHTTEFKGN